MKLKTGKILHCCIHLMLRMEFSLRDWYAIYFTYKDVNDSNWNVVIKTLGSTQTLHATGRIIEYFGQS